MVNGLAANRRAYGWLGRVGVLVPPANTTVEPELAAGMPSGVGVYASRLPGRTEEDTSVGLRERFLQYNATLSGTADSFGGMPLDALVFACTGSSYLVGPRGEDALLADLRAGARQVCTAALAVRQALTACGCRRLALVSPYPSWLTAAAVDYWSACGFEVTGTFAIPQVKSIYAITPEEVMAAALSIPTAGIDGIVLSGTGMPTLDAIPSLSDKLRVPVISSASASIWWVVNALGIAWDGVRSPAVRRIRGWVDARMC